MSGENQQGFLINTESEENASQQSNPGSFILSSPTNSGIRNQSPTLKKTKYDKLLKLYNDVVEKKNKIAPKATELEEKKKMYQEIQSSHLIKSSDNNESAAKLEELRQIKESKRGQHIAEQSNGETRKKEALKALIQLDFQIKQSQKKSEQLNGKRNALANEFIQREKVLSEKKKVNDEVQRNLAELRHQVDSNRKQMEVIPRAAFLLEVQNLEREKADLLKNIDESKNKVTVISKQIEEQEKKLCGACQQQNSGDSQNLAQTKQQLKNLEDKQSALVKRVQQLKEKIEKDKGIISKVSKNLPNIEKNLKESDERLKKVEKQEKQKAGNLQKFRQENKEKFIQVPQEYRQLKVSNEKLKNEVARLEENYRIEKERENSMVPPNVIQNYNEKIERAKQSYEENKNLPDRMKKIEQQIKELRQEKDSLEWNVNPTLKNIQDSQKREVQKIQDLEEQIKKLQKESAQVTSKLEQYAKAYPDYQIERKKSKKSVPSVSPTKKQPKQEKVEDANKKKKKGKGADKSPEPVEEIQLVEQPPKVAPKVEEKPKAKSKKNKKK